MSGFKLQTPVSALVKTGKGGGGVEERKTKDAYRKEKDLEEDRKLGLAPASVDVDTGRDINPHIPHFITSTPWYVPAAGPTLKHQRPHWERQQNPDSTVHEWYTRGTTDISTAPTKFRKGACENCGAMTHKKRDCFERPRKLGAKLTGDDLASDEYIQPNLKLGFDAKRDRWNGYDPATYQEVIKEHEKQEEVRKIIKAEKLKEEQAAAAAKAAEEAVEEGEEGANEEEHKEEPVATTTNVEEEDEDMYAEHAAMLSSVDMDSRTRITVRNLRIREDTAKYLYNLNESAPYYDPKSRSMRENPLVGVKGKEAQAAKFSGENFVRYTGEVAAANEAQVFAWTARSQGIDVHALGEPTKLEQLQKDFKHEKKDVKEETKKKLLEKYGGDEHLEAPPKELLLAQTESYVEYSRHGKIIKGEERPKIRSRYEEDVYPNNHTSIFGSYWKNGNWGYKCCHSSVRNSYCIGEKGFAVNEEMAALPKMAMKKDEEKEEVQPVSTNEVKIEEEEKEVKTEKKTKESSSSSSESEEEEEEEDNSEAEREKKKKREEEEAVEEKRRQERDERKRRKRREKRKRRADKMGGKRKRKRRNSTSSSSDSHSDSDSDSDKSSSDDDTEDAKLQKAVKKAQKEERKQKREAKKDERSRKYNSNYEIKKPTEIEMEAYQITTVHSADPMAAYISEQHKEKETKKK